jgi:hypothetical protein
MTESCKILEENLFRKLISHPSRSLHSQRRKLIWNNTIQLELSLITKESSSTSRFDDLLLIFYYFKTKVYYYCIKSRVQNILTQSNDENQLNWRSNGRAGSALSVSLSLSLSLSHSHSRLCLSLSPSPPLFRAPHLS